MIRVRTWNQVEYEKILADIPLSVRNIVKVEVNKAPDEAVTNIAASIPIGPEKGGHLRDTVRKQPGRSDISVDVYIGDAAHPYPAAYEFGHDVKGTHVPPQRRILPEIRKAKKRLLRRLRRAVKTAIQLRLGGGIKRV